LAARRRLFRLRSSCNSSSNSSSCEANNRCIPLLCSAPHARCRQDRHCLSIPHYQKENSAICGGGCTVYWSNFRLLLPCPHTCAIVFFSLSTDIFKHV
jgi:hypothetical protein